MPLRISSESGILLLRTICILCASEHGQEYWLVLQCKIA